MKKIISILLAIVLVFVLVGCGSNTTEYNCRGCTEQPKIEWSETQQRAFCNKNGNYTSEYCTIYWNKVDTPMIEYIEVIVEIPGDTIYIETIKEVEVLVGYTEEEVLNLMDDIFRWVFHSIDTLEDDNGYIYTYEHDTKSIYYTSDDIDDSSGVVTLAFILEDNY